MGSGQVRQFKVPQSNLEIIQITTYCPDGVGPGGTHIYLIAGANQILFDTGLPTHVAKTLFFPWRFQSLPEAIADLPDDCSSRELESGLISAGYAIENLDALIISHGHPDHYLMGRWIVARSGARTSAHILDTPSIGNPWSPISSWISKQELRIAMGMPPALPDGLAVNQLVSETFNDWSDHQLAYHVDDVLFGDGRLTIQGEPQDGIEVIHLPGHTPGSIGLLVGEPPRVLLCGDALLNPITPIPDNLLQYLQTLARLKQLEGIELVLPGHGKAITDLHARVRQIEQHHYLRLKKCYHLCRTPRTIWQIATTPGFFDVVVKPENFNLMAGMETYAHIELLMHVGGGAAMQN